MKSALQCFLIFLVLRPANGLQTFQWKSGSSSNLWNDATNWVGGTIPTDNSTINITAIGAYTITLAPISAAQLSLRFAAINFCPGANSGMTLSITGGVLLTVAKGLFVCVTGQITVTSASLLLHGTARIDGRLSVLQDGIFSVVPGANLLGHGLLLLDSCQLCAAASTAPHQLSGTSSLQLLVASGAVSVVGSFAQAANMTIQPSSQLAQGAVALINLTAGALFFTGPMLTLSAVELLGALNTTVSAAGAGMFFLAPGSSAFILGAVTLRDATLLTAGTVHVAAGGQTTLAGGGAVENDGVWKLAAGSLFVLAGVGAQVMNRGDLEYADGATAHRIQCPCALDSAAFCAGAAVFTTGRLSLSPDAALILESGCQLVFAGPAGTADLPAGATVTCLLSDAAQPCIDFGRGAVLSGAGTLQGAVRSNGTVRPGPPDGGGPGTLSILGPLVQEAAGVLLVSFDPNADKSSGGGLASGLLVSGGTNTVLGGTVTVQWLSESPPPIGTTLLFLSAVQSTPAVGLFAAAASIQLTSGAKMSTASLELLCVPAESGGCLGLEMAVVGCPPGWWAVSATACAACAAGRYSAGRGSASCHECNLVGGRWSKQPAALYINVAFSPCPSMSSLPLPLSRSLPVSLSLSLPPSLGR